MVITSEITMDLLRPAPPQIVYAKQGDVLSRSVKINLLYNGMEWKIPAGTAFSVCYAKADGKGGIYKQFEAGDGVVSAATTSESAVIVNLNPQALTCPGTVRCEVRMSSGDAQLSTFTFFINVQASPESEIKSEDYWNLSRDDRTVFASEKMNIDAGTAASFDVSKFLTTPHVGDAVIGADGYIGTVIAASGTTITVTATGEKLFATESATGTVIVRGMSDDGDLYTASGDDLPEVVPGSNGFHTGKGTQIIFIPACANSEAEPSLQLNDGAAVPIKLRSTADQSAAVESLPVGALRRGVPYMMTFCGLYWLVDSYIKLSGEGSGSGADGVGIASVEQTKTSTEDGGKNEITVTLTDGSTSVFTVKNGSKGSPGADGYTNPLTVNGVAFDGSVAMDMTDTINAMIDEKINALDATGVSY